ncbi:MAG: NAD(P)-dependent glycerol-3-phosphate dehydrogenase [Clostridia bacterium]|nr:NAD(P)-dependent glycerol-3-phosphate dehydrogenase [Clostridia bacterium]
MKIAVIGSGGWGIAAAKLLCENGNEVVLWSFLEDEADMLRKERANEKLLRGVKLPESIEITTDLGCAQDKDIIVMVTPSFGVRNTARKIKNYVNSAKAIVLLTKGFDAEADYCLLSDTIESEISNVPVVALTGPSHAEEVARRIPTAVLAASRDKSAAEIVQNVFMNDYFRVYTSPDIVSAELGGAMKNIMALAVGISDGAGFGDNTKAMIMTRGISEMSRLGVALGGKSHTFAGLSGVGDLIVTCVSDHSRNRRAGLLIGKGTQPQQALKEVGAVVEGYYATKAVHELVKNMDIELPICNGMYSLLFEGEPLQDVFKALIGRNKRSESDKDIW